MTDIEVDAALADDDGCDSGYLTESTLLASSIQEYVFENGRRYHSYFGVEKNLMPIDETEQNRMDMAHELMLRLLDGALHKAPLVESPERVLDVGTGTGIWAIDMAVKHPGAEVTGIDLSPIQPNWVPSNCHFLVDDAEREWIFNDNTFDLIHMRNLDQGISNWPNVLSEATRCLKPGHYLELSELGVIFNSDDGTMTEDTPAYRWSVLLEEALARAGRPALVKGMLEQRLKDAGYEDIHTFNLKLPFGPWAKEKRIKELGYLTLLAAESGFQAYGMAAFTRILGMTNAEADAICREGLASVNNRKHHMYVYHYIAYGRKPSEET